MKKNTLLLIILGVIIIPTIYFIFQNTGSTVKKEISDFAVKDTAAITKIFIADRNGNKITLEKKEDNKWILNDKYEPRPDLLKLLLVGIYKIEVRNRVAKAAYNNVIKALAASGTKCEIYLKGSTKPFKTYYIGGQTEDALGTFMIIENSNMPFVVEIPGFNGYLTPRYSPDVEAWRQPVLFQTPVKNIKSVSINYANFPEKSFIIYSENGSYNVESPLKNKKLEHVDSVAVENYLSFYSNAFYEARVKEMSENKKDSIRQYPPSIVLTLVDINNNKKEVDIYPMPISAASLAQQDSTGKPLKFDVDRMYAFLKPEKEFVIVQHFSFDKLLRQISDFDEVKPKLMR